MSLVNKNLFGSEIDTANDGEVVTSTSKNQNGWQCRTDIKFGHDRLLRITTRKSLRGGLYTNGTVYTLGVSSMCTEILGDFSKNFASDEFIRCTEKSVAALHQSVLNNLAAIKTEVAAFYLAKFPRPCFVVQNAAGINENFSGLLIDVINKNKQASELVGVVCED